METINKSLTMRERLDFLIELLPEMTISDLKHLFNLARQYNYKQQRLDKLDTYSKLEKDKTAIQITVHDLSSLKWAIEIISKEKFERIDEICNKI
jgi:hypothetical protein